MASDSDDDISLASTEVSDHDADTVYEVDKILASKILEGVELYLVKWKNYPIERSTWEPISSFTDTSTVAEWHQTAARQQRSQEPPFDWRAWDRQREIDEQAAFERRRKRERKREKIKQQNREKKRERERRTRARDDSPSLDGFIIEDDDASSLIDDSSDSESDLPERLRRDDLDSEDSLVKETLAKRQIRKKGESSRRQRRQLLLSSEDESPPGSPKSKATDSRPKSTKQGKRRRVSSPGEGLARSAQDASPNAKKKKRRKLEWSKTSTNAAPAKPGPFRTDKRRTSGGTSGTFNTMSYLNKVQKAGRVEPPPDLSKIELFAPAMQPRGSNMPRRPSVQSPTALNPPEHSSNSTKQNGDGRLSPTRPQITPLYGGFRIPKRKPTASGPAQSPVEQQEDDYFSVDSRKEPGSASNVSHDSRQPDKMDVDETPHPPNQDLVISPPQNMEIDSVKSTGPRTFDCTLASGPSATTVGKARFLGFNAVYIDELEKKKDCQVLWISKFYGQDYIKDCFAPHYGSPLHVGAIEIDLDEVQPLVNTLSFLKGAGIILHEDFTMLLFIPSNTDLRGAFKLPQQVPQLSAKLKPALRVVVYPRLKGTMIPFKDMARHYQPMQAGPTSVTPRWEQDIRFSLPTYMSLTIGIDWDEILEVDRNKGEALILLVYPPIAEAEGREYREAFETLGRTVIGISEVSATRGRIIVMVHQSLRRQLHLIPQINHLRKKTDFNFWFFGLKIDQGVIEDRPQKIWLMGAVIFITPQLIAASPSAFQSCLDYQATKPVTTILMLPSTWEDKLLDAMQKEPNEAVLLLIFDIKRKIEEGRILLLKVQLHSGVDEFETYLDAFAFYQLDNHVDYRRFCVGHTQTPRNMALDQLYGNIEFYTAEKLGAEFNQGVRKK